MMIEPIDVLLNGMIACAATACAFVYLCRLIKLHPRASKLRLLYKASMLSICGYALLEAYSGSAGLRELIILIAPMSWVAMTTPSIMRLISDATERQPPTLTDEIKT